ncbi:MAG TPA: glycerophosphodiester phosphodiesterase [Acidimicrobiia bacterium]|nr:glycerophosphodiester phosphodiesterase [Acidimicrobiia bacterium]
MSGRLLVIGHRGWPARFPDNTLAGLIAAADVADGVEVDVRRCGDGRLVLSHDPFLHDRAVAETSWAVLSELDLGEGHHPVLLDEALAALPGISVQLEVKNMPFDPGFEPDHRIALETAERARPGDVVTSFNTETLSAVRRVFPDVATGMVTQASIALGEAIEHCLHAGHTTLIPNHSQVTSEINADIAVFPWTVNDPIRARELADSGVRGIITDDPGRMVTDLGTET